MKLSGKIKALVIEELTVQVGGVVRLIEQGNPYTAGLKRILAYEEARLERVKADQTLSTDDIEGIIRALEDSLSLTRKRIRSARRVGLIEARQRRVHLALELRAALRFLRAPITPTDYVIENAQGEVFDSTGQILRKVWIDRHEGDFRVCAHAYAGGKYLGTYYEKYYYSRDAVACFNRWCGREAA